MKSLILGLAGCACALISTFAANAVRAEDIMKSDLMESYTTHIDPADTDTASASKADCIKKAEMETDATKKTEMMKACDN